MGEDGMPSVAETLSKVRSLAGAGKGPEAYGELLLLFGAVPERLEERAPFQTAMKLLAELSRAFGAGELAEKIARCAAMPDDPQALYDAAYGLFEERQFAPAVTLLSRANGIAPGQPAIVSELSVCLERLLRYDEAVLHLDASGVVGHDPVCTYMSGYCWLMSGDIERSRERLDALAGVTDPEVASLRDALAGMHARANAMRGAGIALDDHALTAWQAVINGTVLLHESPFGHDEPMRGRYAFLADSPGFMREGLDRLKAVLAALGELPTRVVAAPDRESRILARAAGSLFGVPVLDWAPGEEREGLVVAWDMDHVPDPAFLDALRLHAPAQRLFVHASCWTEPFSYSPDVTTLLHQQLTHPWTGGALRVDPETRQVTRAEADSRSDGALAAEIIGAEASNPSVSTLDTVLSVVHALATVPEPHRGGLSRGGAPRARQRAGGPVASHRF